MSRILQLVSLFSLVLYVCVLACVLLFLFIVAVWFLFSFPSMTKGVCCVMDGNAQTIYPLTAVKVGLFNILAFIAARSAQ